MADNDRFAGKADEGLGTVKEKLGEITGNRDIEAEGNVQKNKGRAQNA